jgi:DNA primase large subunit
LWQIFHLLYLSNFFLVFHLQIAPIISKEIVKDSAINLIVKAVVEVVAEITIKESTATLHLRTTATINSEEGTTRDLRSIKEIHRIKTTAVAMVNGVLSSEVDIKVIKATRDTIPNSHAISHHVPTNSQTIQVHMVALTVASKL